MAIPGGTTKAPGAAAAGAGGAEAEGPLLAFAAPPEEPASAEVVSPIGGGVGEEDSEPSDFSRADMGLVRDGS